MEKYEAERLSNPNFNGFANELDHYLYRKIENNNPKLARGLQDKLIDGNREYILNYAKECKHKINKKIMKHSLYKSANDVFIYLLTSIWDVYFTSIKSKIISKHFQIYEIDEFINKEVIEILWVDCQLSDLFDDRGDLFGLLYLLAGNCHIDWDMEI